MASLINISIPADNVKVDKALLRENFRRAKEEIDLQQRVTSFAWRMATNQTSI